MAINRNIFGICLLSTSYFTQKPGLNIQDAVSEEDKETLLR